MEWYASHRRQNSPPKIVDQRKSTCTDPSIKIDRSKSIDHKLDNVQKQHSNLNRPTTQSTDPDRPKRRHVFHNRPTTVDLNSSRHTAAGVKYLTKAGYDTPRAEKQNCVVCSTRRRTRYLDTFLLGRHSKRTSFATSYCICITTSVPPLPAIFRDLYLHPRQTNRGFFELVEEKEKAGNLGGCPTSNHSSIRSSEFTEAGTNNNPTRFFLHLFYKGRPCELVTI